MSENKKGRSRKVLSANAFLTGGLFLVGAFQFGIAGKFLVSVIQFLVACLNIAEGIHLRKPILNFKMRFIWLGLGNVIVAICVAVDYIQAGSRYIQYVWFLVALMWIACTAIQWRVERQKNSPAAKQA